MQLTETIIAFSGTAIGGAIIGKWLNRKKDALEAQLKNQVFYKTLIQDLNEQRTIEKEEIAALKEEIKTLSAKISELINLNEEKDKAIKGQKNNLLRWENNCLRLEDIIKQKDKQIATLFEELEELEEAQKREKKSK